MAVRALLMSNRASINHFNNHILALREDLERLRKDTESLLEGARPRIEDPARLDFNSYATSVPFSDAIQSKLRTGPIRIVDVGAKKFDGQNDLYKNLYANCACEIIGFDPQIGQSIRMENEGSSTTILPFALGDGQSAPFYVTEHVAASSTLRPNATFLEQFLGLPTMLKVRNEMVIETKRLDDVGKIEGCDLLKLDIPGGELAVLEGGVNLLRQTSFVLIQVKFSRLYEGQSLFHHVDSFLRSQNFFLLNLINPGASAFKAGMFADLQSRLMWMEAVYVKDFSALEELVPEAALKAACLAHVLLRNAGLAAAILEVFDRKTGGELLKVYQHYLKTSRLLFDSRGAA
jgi:FkbM family methyltransferase